MLELLAALERSPGSRGERTAAELIAGELEARGARTGIEIERVHGTYWVPIGLASAAATLAGCAGRFAGAALASTACLCIADDLALGRRPLRRVLKQRVVRNVTGEFGPERGAATVVIHAHHDAAHTGLVFHPVGAKLATRVAGRVMERFGGTPPPMWGAVAGAGAVATAQLLGLGRLRRLGMALSAGYTAAMIDIWRRSAVPGANDNLSGVYALLRIADALADEPPTHLRVILLSTGSEESFLEAMIRFGERHFLHLPRDTTTFLCLESVGSPQLMLLAGEGLLRLRPYPKDLIARLTQLASENQIPLRRPFRYRLATDGQVPLRAGYAAAVISSMDWYKAPSNYHWPTDLPRNLHRESLDHAAELARAYISSLDHDMSGTCTSVIPAS